MAICYPWGGTVQQNRKPVEDAQGEIDRAWPGRDLDFVAKVERRQSAIKWRKAQREAGEIAKIEAARAEQRRIEREARRERRRLRFRALAIRKDGDAEIAVLEAV